MKNPKTVIVKAGTKIFSLPKNAIATKIPIKIRKTPIFLKSMKTPLKYSLFLNYLNIIPIGIDEF